MVANLFSFVWMKGTMTVILMFLSTWNTKVSLKVASSTTCLFMYTVVKCESIIDKPAVLFTYSSRKNTFTLDKPLTVDYTNHFGILINVKSWFLYHLSPKQQDSGMHYAVVVWVGNSLAYQVLKSIQNFNISFLMMFSSTSTCITVAIYNMGTVHQSVQTSLHASFNLSTFCR